MRCLYSSGDSLDELGELGDETVHQMLAESECEVQACQKPLGLEDIHAPRILAQLT